MTTPEIPPCRVTAAVFSNELCSAHITSLPMRLFVADDIDSEVLPKFKSR
jgi:hypothetical protein